ncbi:MAG: sulfate ABC transporter permease subunit CysW [Acetobacteraceae bacterium]|nr:sulfate ABC transporter permease subunit CysW [Acetobacteraceae bacterium]
MPGERGIGEPGWVRVALVLASIAVFAVMLAMPLAVVFTEALSKGWQFALDALSDPDALAAIWLTLLVALIVVPLNTAFGLAAAWCIVHFRFPGRALLVALVELPFAVSPVISGMIYVLLFGRQGWLGPLLAAHGVKIVFALPGIVLATTFVTLPFVARQLVPLMQAQGTDEEEAALTLGAGGWQVFRRVTLPKVRWALLTGMLLCNARSMGEFGAVSVVSGHIRGLTNTMPLHVQILYNGYDIAGAFAMSALLACLGLATLALRELLAWRARRAEGCGAQAVLVPA